jgi:hypothetical protein
MSGSQVHKRPNGPDDGRFIRTRPTDISEIPNPLPFDRNAIIWFVMAFPTWYVPVRPTLSIRSLHNDDVETQPAIRKELNTSFQLSMIHTLSNSRHSRSFVNVVTCKGPN